MKSPLISIIVPCYKVEKYLPKCIESILNQTYKNLEIFLIDDGSPDNSGKICDEYALKDKRIKVIHKKNGGASEARNIALDLMTGEYVAFVDSDDYVSSYYIETMYNLLIQTNADISVCGHTNVSEKRLMNTITFRKPQIKRYHLLTSNEAIKNVFYQKIFDCSPWGKLYHSSIFKTIRYPKGVIYEDLAIIYPLLQQSKYIVIFDTKLYYYLIRESSTLGVFNEKRRDILLILDNLENQLREENSPFLNAIISRNLSAHFNLLGLASWSNHPYRDIEKECWKYICKNRIRCLVDKNVRLQNRIGIIVSYFGKHILKYFLKFNNR